MAADWLRSLERSLAKDREGDALATALVLLAAVAGRGVPLEEEEARGASRRALLLLAGGGDPSRGLDLDGRAVRALAAELDGEARRAALGRGILELRGAAAGLAHVSEALHALLDVPDVAWRAYACSLLAEALGGDE